MTTGTAVLASAAPSAQAASCSPGARTLSQLGDHVYPDTGNGGYTSVHTDLYMQYDAITNRFLPGNHVDLTDVATKCLTEFSLDLERTSADTDIGPDLSVDSVTVNGKPATFRFVQPTYPGDPNGPNDPDPRAHQAGQNAVVGGPDHNPLPPACSPELPEDAATVNAADGTACPANKMIITPKRKIRSGSQFVVQVAYTGRPGVHRDGDGSTEGWFRSDNPAGDGGFVTTEPVGTQDWMPLNNHPTAKPTYDFYDTVTKGRTAVANGIMVKQKTGHSRNFPNGYSYYHWHSAAPVASYLVENSVGVFDLSKRVADNGIIYYTVQGSSIPGTQKAANAAIIAMQQDITDFESQFNGTYPFTSAGVLVGVPSASFEEEMQTMITFAGGRVGTSTLYHENMHQWWGDNVTESNYNMVFFKEGMATLSEYYYVARQAETAAGGPSTAAGNAAFEASLAARFTTNYGRTSLFTGVPSDPTSASLFSGSSTYTRPGTAYLALRQIMGSTAFNQAAQAIQRTYGGKSITEPELEAAFSQYLPDQSGQCTGKLSRFFTQWFDTAYPQRGKSKPTITGANFYRKNGNGCA